MQSPTMSARRRKRLTITQEGGTTFICLGNMEIWDGADLALVRDTLIEQVQKFDRWVIAINMESVKYIPSGFFGMISEWKDRGVCISIKGVQENVSKMLWFQQFFLEFAPGMYRLQSEPQFEMNSIFADLDQQTEQRSDDDSEPLELDPVSLEEVHC